MLPRNVELVCQEIKYKTLQHLEGLKFALNKNLFLLYVSLLFTSAREEANHRRQWPLLDRVGVKLLTGATTTLDVSTLSTSDRWKIY